MILFLLLLLSGCSKDEEIAELEQEIRESEAVDPLAERPEASDTTAAAEEPGEVVMTPEAAPTEEPVREEMPRRPDIAGYTVQVAAGTNYEYTSELVDLFNQRGYEAFVTDAVVGGQTFYRVRIGTFEDKRDAKALGEELKDKYSVSYWIDYNQ
jgi:DedD protein